MSKWEVDGREVNSNSLWRLIEDFENGALSPGEQEELLSILEESRRARSIYLEYCEMSALLQIQAATEDEEGTLPVVNVRQRHRKLLTLSVVAAAAMVALFAGIAAFVQLNSAEPRSVELAASNGSVWNVSSEGEDPGPRAAVVREGSSLHVTSGTVMVELDSGTRLVVQGPARVRFPKLEEPVLEHGWLWADTGGNSSELRISTDALRFRDIGTRFGVRVRDDRKAELHVIEGIVEVFANETGEATKVLPGKAGVAIGVDGGMEGITLVGDPFPGLPDLLKARPLYATMVMGQAPSGYWRLDETKVGIAANEMQGASPGVFAQSVDPNVAGVRPSLRLKGFETDNGGVYLPGEDVQSLLYHLDPGTGVSPMEGAVAFWFRRNADIESSEVLWYAGVPGGRGMGPETEMHAFLAASGHVKFFIEAGEQDVLLGSSQSLADGQWHHLVASWVQGRVALYIDGELADEEEDYVAPDWGSLMGNHVRFGKTGASIETSPQTLGYFRGWADEIALWRRSLTSAEVALQFRAACGEVE